MQDNWCWAAVATSVGLFYGTGNWTQCAVATDQVNKLISPGQVNDCCSTPDSQTCDVYGYVYFALQHVRSIDHWSPKKPLPQELYDRLSRDKEVVCLRIKWNGGGAHFTTIRGCTDPADGGPFIISTSDTLKGFSGTTLPYDDFPAHYHAGGEWTSTFFTSGRFRPATACGSAEGIALDANNNGNSVSLRSRGTELVCSVGKIDRLANKVSWGAEAALGTGTLGGIGVDDAGNCVVVHSGGGQLFFRAGLLDPVTGALSWGPVTAYGVGSSNAIAMMEHATCLEAHVHQGKLYTSGGWLRGDGGMDWDEPDPFGQGDFMTIAAGTDGTCIELHSGVGPDAGKLFCTPGVFDFLKSKVKWGKTAVVGAGPRGSVSLGANGRCIVSFIENGRVHLRSGQMEFEATAIEWFPSVALAKGEATAISIDDLGRCIETHVTQKALFCALGRH